MAANGKAADDGLLQDGMSAMNTSLGKRPIVQSVDSSGTASPVTNQLIQIGSDPSKASATALFIQVAP